MTLIYSIWGLRRFILIIQNVMFQLFWGKQFKNRVRVFGLPIISFAKFSKVTIGKNLVLISHSFFSEPGVNHPVVIRTLNSNAQLVIGDNVGISGGSICVAQEINIGSNVMLGANVLITDTDFHPIVQDNRRFSSENVGTRPVYIENNVFIGTNTMVLKGAHIGKNSVIGAGSIVTGEIPPESIAVGIPAKVIGKVS
jgi:acetyltransferase-like isoleucine patch superfamily enzyme